MVDHIDLDTFFDEDRIHPWIGCTTDRGIPKDYWKHFMVYEQSPHDLSAKGSTLKKWRINAPDQKQFIARIDPQILTHVDLLKADKGEEFNTLFKRCIVRPLALESSSLLLHTSAQFRPSADHEKRVIEIIRMIREELNPRLPEFKIVWRADGLWEESDHYLDLCKEHNLIPCIDPLMWSEDDPLPQNSHYYWRILGQRGLSVRLSDFDLDRLAEFSADMQCPGWVIFASPHLMPVAKKWRTWFV